MATGVDFRNVWIRVQLAAARLCTSLWGTSALASRRAWHWPHSAVSRSCSETALCSPHAQTMVMTTMASPANLDSPSGPSSVEPSHLQISVDLGSIAIIYCCRKATNSISAAESVRRCSRACDHLARALPVHRARFIHSWNNAPLRKPCRDGGIGRRRGLKIPWPQGRPGSSPGPGTTATIFFADLCKTRIPFDLTRAIFPATDRPRDNSVVDARFLERTPDRYARADNSSSECAKSRRPGRIPPISERFRR